MGWVPGGRFGVQLYALVAALPFYPCTRGLVCLPLYQCTRVYPRRGTLIPDARCAVGARCNGTSDGRVAALDRGSAGLESKRSGNAVDAEVLSPQSMTRVSTLRFHVRAGGAEEQSHAGRERSLNKGHAKNIKFH